MKIKYLLAFFLLLKGVALAQIVPLSAHSTQGTFLSDEKDLWFVDQTGVWVPFGNAYLINRAMITVSNVAAMVTVPAWSNSLAKYVQTMGYYSPGDGGGGLYVQTAKTATNMGQFSSTNSSYMWKLVGDGNGIRLKQYGAKGDGTSDDTLAVKDWLHDINQKVGIVNVGTYMIQPIFTEASSVLTIQGANKFGLTSPNINSFLFDGNSARFKRISSSGSTNALFNVVSNAVCNMYSIILDGNKAGDPTQTSAYLYLNNGGLSGEVESCYFGNSAGHGIGIVGPGGNWSVIRNCRIYDVNRGIRLNQTSGVTINNVHIQFCRDNGLSLVQFATMTRCNQLFVSDCALNGIFLEGATHNRISDTEVRTTFQSGVMMSMTNVANIQDNSFLRCTFLNANAVTSSLLGASPFGPSLYSPVMVVSDAAAYCIRNVFDGCLFGDLTGNSQNRGKYNFEWTALNSGSHYPWEMWMFANNQYVWSSQWLADFGPGMTNNVAEINGLHTSASFQSQFGMAGAINGAGFRVDVVPAGATGGANAVTYLNSTSHAVLRDTAGYGTPVNPTTQVHTNFILPTLPTPKEGPVPDP